MAWLYRFDRFSVSAASIQRSAFFQEKGVIVSKGNDDGEKEAAHIRLDPIGRSDNVLIFRLEDVK